MDPQTFLDIATKVTKLKMYPYFDIAHYTLMCVAARDDVPANSSGKVTQHCHIWLFTARASFTITVARHYVIWIVLMTSNLMEFLIQYVKVDQMCYFLLYACP